MSGYGPSPDAATEPDARAGYQMVVTRVREGLSGMPAHGGVEREMSTKVSVVVATEFELAAAATVGTPTNAGPMAKSRRKKAIVPTDTTRWIASIRPSRP